MIERHRGLKPAVYGLVLIAQTVTQFNTDLLNAVKRSDVATVRFLLAQPRVNINIKDADGISPLMWWCLPSIL